MKVFLLLALCGLHTCAVNGQLDGADQCTEGPDFWCSSVAAANKCSVYQYCSSQVWTNGVPPASSETAEEPTRRPPPGSNPCTRGPAFWCFSLDNADLCNAYEYCSEHVWADTPPSASTPVNVEGAEKAMVALFDPEQAAETMFSTLDNLMAVKVPFDDCDCEACYYLVNLGNSWLKQNSTRQLIKSYYNKLCMNIPASMQEHCTDVVGKHFISVIEDLADMDPKKACKDTCQTDIPAGQQSVLPKIKVQDKPVNTCLCQVCQQIFQDFAQSMGQKRFQNEIVSEFERLCAFMPDAAVASCKTTASQYIPELYAMLSHLNPAMACNRFKFCQNHTAMSPDAEQPTQVAIRPVTKKVHFPCIGPYFDLTKRNADGSIPQEVLEITRLAGLVTIPSDDCQCESCKYYYGQFAACLKRNATRNWINTFYRKICLDIPASMQEHCTDVVMNHFAQLTEDLGKIDPDKACKRDCKNASEVAKVEDKSLSVTNTCLCKQCQSYVQELASLMGEKTYQQDFVKEYTRLCHFLKDDVALQKCTNETKEYFPELFEMLSNMSPVQTCNHFKYCQKP